MEVAEALDVENMVYGEIYYLNLIFNWEEFKLGRLRS